MHTLTQVPKHTVATKLPVKPKGQREMEQKDGPAGVGVGLLFREEKAKLWFADVVVVTTKL